MELYPTAGDTSEGVQWGWFILGVLKLKPKSKPKPNLKPI